MSEWIIVFRFIFSSEKLQRMQIYAHYFKSLVEVSVKEGLSFTGVSQIWNIATGNLPELP